MGDSRLRGLTVLKTAKDLLRKIVVFRFRYCATYDATVYGLQSSCARQHVPHDPCIQTHPRDTLSHALFAGGSNVWYLAQS